ncbi:MAG: PocR ligand-binding domain-containing protein [bacterium]|nr:PocR ligand-binding domain-containing protein [bacterium]
MEMTERITKIELPVISKVTDLIEPKTLDLILKGLSEEKRAMVVEEMDGEEIKRVPVRDIILTSYWSPLCEYIHKFKIGEAQCRNSTEKLARDILEGKTETGRHSCFLGLEVCSIPFLFQGRRIGVLLGGKYRTEKSDIEKKLDKLDRSILIKEGFDREKAKRCILQIKKVTEENINDDIERLKEAASRIMEMGRQNYTSKKNLVYQQVRSELMRYSIEKSQVGLSMEKIFQKILEEVNHLFKIEYSIFVLTHRGDDMIISSPRLPLTQKIIREIIRDIKENFKKDGVIYWWKKEEGTKYLARIRDKVGLNSLPISVYATSLCFRDDSQGFLFFINPERRGGNDEDFREFVQILTEVITTQVNIWVGEEEKADFVAEMVHRLKAPMQLLLTKCSTLENRLGKTPGVEETIQGIKNAVTLLDHQTKSYSFITVKDDRGYFFKRQLIHLLMKKCIQRFEPIANTHNITIKPMEITGKIEEIEIDKEMIDVAFNNLLDNAIKYSPSGSYISIRISFNPVEETICLFIANKGYRILLEEKERIFERYYRGQQVKGKTFIPGTGIGLTVIKDIIEKVHKGRIDVKSEPRDSGDYSNNLFSIHLPYHQEVKM